MHQESSQRQRPLSDPRRQLDEMSATNIPDLKQFAPARAHLSENTSPYALPTNTLSDQKPFNTALWSIKSQPRVYNKPQWVEASRRRKIPQELLPSEIADADTPYSANRKYSYVNMQRIFLVTCATIATLCLAVGTWMFATAAPNFAWYALYVVVTQLHLFASLFITALGKPFNLPAHKRLLDEHPLDVSKAPTIDIYLPVCNEPAEVLENTWKHIANLQ